MIRRVHIIALALVAATPLLAQAPKGWLMRVDRSTSARDPDAGGPIKFVTMGSGFHATNPLAAVWAGAMLLHHLGETEAAQLIMHAMERVAREGPHTPDLRGKASTREVGAAVVRALGSGTPDQKRLADSTAPQLRKLIQPYLFAPASTRYLSMKS